MRRLRGTATATPRVAGLAGAHVALGAKIGARAPQGAAGAENQRLLRPPTGAYLRLVLRRGGVYVQNLGWKKGRAARPQPSHHLVDTSSVVAKLQSERVNQALRHKGNQRADVPHQLREL